MVCRKFLYVVLLLFFSVWQQNCWAWSQDTDSWIAQTAFSLLSDDMQAALAPYQQSLLAGVQSKPNANFPDNPQSLQVFLDTIANDLKMQALMTDDVAFQLGILAQAIAEMSYPVSGQNQTVDMLTIGQLYQTDVLKSLKDFTPKFPPGPDLCPVPGNTIQESAKRAEYFHDAVVTSYTSGNGYQEVEKITELCLRRAVEDVVNIWTTFWVTNKPGLFHFLAMSANQSEFNPGDTLQISISVAAGQTLPAEADLYIVCVYDGNTLFYLSAAGDFVDTAVPWKSSWIIPELASETIISVSVPMLYENAGVKMYALLVSPGKDPGLLDAWISNLVKADLTLEAFPLINLADLKDESYLFSATGSTPQELIALPLRRWDMIFLGDLQDNPTTPWVESWANDLIPGKFSHVLVYMGRDEQSRPWGVEMTLGSSQEGNVLRFVRLPEFESFPAEVNSFDLTIGPKAVMQYQTRWAMRLSDKELSSIKKVETQLLQQIQDDWNTGFMYQLEFAWSGLLWEKEIYLVDDGRNEGASCTDYWLTLFESFAGVCIKGSRISASEIYDYYLNDPVGSVAIIPQQVNPFGFELTLNQLLAIGFYTVDPPSHVFACDGEKETGVPIPSRLITSPQLVEIGPVPVVLKYW